MLSWVSFAEKMRVHVDGLDANGLKWKEKHINPIVKSNVHEVNIYHGQFLINFTFAELIANVRFSCFLNRDIFPFLVLLIALLSMVSGTAILISSLMMWKICNFISRFHISGILNWNTPSSAKIWLHFNFEFTKE